MRRLGYAVVRYGFGGTWAPMVCETHLMGGAFGERPRVGRAWRDERRGAKTAKLQRVVENQAKQDGAQGKGDVLNQQGKDVEEITRDTLAPGEGANVREDFEVGKGKGSRIDKVTNLIRDLTSLLTENGLMDCDG
jgi:hypothetical protein